MRPGTFSKLMKLQKFLVKPRYGEHAGTWDAEEEPTQAWPGQQQEYGVLAASFN